MGGGCKDAGEKISFGRRGTQIMEVETLHAQMKMRDCDGAPGLMTALTIDDD